MLPATRRWLVLIIVVGALLRFVPIWFGLPYPQARPDEETAIGKALDALKGEPNPRFFHWPSLTIYLFAGVLRIASAIAATAGEGRALTFTEQALVARALVALAGTATLLVLFWLSRRVAGERVALIATAFLAVAVLHVRESHFAMTDVLMTMLAWASLLVLVDAIAEPRDRVVRACAVAGLLAGLATAAKYNAAAVAFAMLAAQGLLFTRAPRSALSVRGWMPTVAYAAAMVAAFLAGTPYAALDWPTFSRDLAFNFGHLSEGHRGIDLGRGWLYHATHSLPYGVGIPVFLTALAGIVPFARHHRPAAAVLGAFAVTFYVIVGSGYTVFFRYVLPLLPLVCLLAAVGVTRAADWISRRWQLRSAGVFVCLLVLSAGPSLVHSVWFDLVLARTDTRVLAGQWLEQRIRAEDSLYDAGNPYTRLDLWRVTFNRADYDAAENAFRGIETHTPDWLVLHESPLQEYTATPVALQKRAESEFVLVYVARGVHRGQRVGMYDRQDAFFMPLSRFWTVERPGPTIFIYKRIARARRGNAAG